MHAGIVVLSPYASWPAPRPVCCQVAQLQRRFLGQRAVAPLTHMFWLLLSQTAAFVRGAVCGFVGMACARQLPVVHSCVRRDMSTRQRAAQLHGACRADKLSWLLKCLIMMSGRVALLSTEAAGTIGRW